MTPPPDDVLGLLAPLLPQPPQPPPRLRPPAWHDAEPPHPAEACCACWGRRWWSEAEPPRRGWRCACCIPPPPGLAVIEIGPEPPP